jgi:CheY-like chemotaxis protein
MMRDDDSLSEVPIMAVTAYSARATKSAIRAAGAQAYVSKPISVMRFAETVDAARGQRPIDRRSGAGAMPERPGP